MKEDLFFLKYRPKTLNEIALPDRIKKIFQNGEINTNYIFYGPWGRGKTSLAKLLVENKYAYQIFDDPDENKIDTIRGKVTDFCTSYSILGDPNSVKVAIFDEFDRGKSAYQEAMKAFIEKHSKNIRFIFISNNFNKIDKGIVSRCETIDFEFQNEAERKQVYNSFGKYCINIINKENISIDATNLVKIVDKNFPDMRKTLNVLQNYKYTGNLILEKEDDIVLYDMIYNDSSSEELWNYITAHYGNRLDDVYYMLGKDFYKWLNKRNTDMYLKKLGNLTLSYRDSTRYYKESIDPLVEILGLIYEYKNILHITDYKRS